MKRPPLHTLAQFRRATDGMVLACRVKGHIGRQGLVVAYVVPESGEIIHDARILTRDLVSDEAAVTGRSEDPFFQ